MPVENVGLSEKLLSPEGPLIRAPSIDGQRGCAMHEFKLDVVSDPISCVGRIGSALMRLDGSYVAILGDFLLNLRFGLLGVCRWLGKPEDQIA